MADGNQGGVSVLFLGALVVLGGLAFVSCDADFLGNATTPDAVGSGDVTITDGRAPAAVVGQVVTAAGARVAHVAADEGFWVDLGGQRVWVQLLTVRESAYTVRAGDVVSFRGTVVAHDDAYPRTLAMCTPADAVALAAQDTHIEVPAADLAFGVG